jgi:hypothetical protein
MIRSIAGVLFLSLVPFVLAGCHSTQKSDAMTAPRLVAGLARRTKLHGDGVITNLKLNWKARAFGFHAAYEFDNGGGEGSYWFMMDSEHAAEADGVPSLDAKNAGDDTDFFVGDGCAYVRIDKFPKNLPSVLDERVLPHAWPIVVTQQIRVGAEGTTFIVQNDTNASKDHSTQRVFLLDPPPSKPLLIMNTDVQNPKKLSELKTQLHYSEFENGKCVKDDELMTADLLKQATDVKNKAAVLCK